MKVAARNHPQHFFGRDGGTPGWPPSSAIFEELNFRLLYEGKQLSGKL
jgi:hypothetical protein